MSLLTEEWPTTAIIVQRKTRTYYSRFYLTLDHVIQREYLCGSTLVVTICGKSLIALITHLWVFEESEHGHVRLKLFAIPDDLPHGRTHNHGEHELLLFHKPVTLTCNQLQLIEDLHSQWSLGVPLQPPSSLTPPSTPPPHQLTHSLYCNEVMVPVGGFHDETGVSPASSPVLSRGTRCSSSYQLRIISYPAYCRYCTVLKRFSPNPYEYMGFPLVQAMGGIPCPPVPTVVLFCRKLFRDMNLERKLSLLEEGIMVNSSNDTCQLTAKDRNNPYPLRRKRARPRKPEYTSPPKYQPGPPAVKRKRGRPRKHPLPDTVEPPTVIMPTQIEPLQINVDSIANVAPPTTNIPMPTHQPLPLSEGAVMSNGGSHEMFDNNFSPRSSSSSDDSAARALRPRDSLLPPPQFRDDSIYDTKLHLLLDSIPQVAPPSSKQVNITTTTGTKLVNASNAEKEAAKQLLLLHTKKQQNNHHEVKPSVAPLVITPSSLPPPSLPPPSLPTPPPSLPPPPPRAISPDVKQLLRAHLLKLQDNGLTESQAMLQNLDEHLLEEKPFLDLLFCFMKLRNTPIHKIPRLGSKYLNLYNLFHSTNRMGGYDQVTVNRKWSTVFESMGCSAGMTCASTVTRKHYEKLLLPFEKALIAMRQATTNTSSSSL